MDEFSSTPVFIKQGEGNERTFNAYQVSARSLHMLSRFIFQLREV